MAFIDLDWSEGVGWGLALVGFSAAILVGLLIAPIAIRKLRGAGIVGRDKHKEGRPEVAEMGGLIPFVGLMAGAVVMLALARLPDADQSSVLTALLACTGAVLTGVIDDLISLRQRFKAMLPIGFAIPLALGVQDTTIWFPVIGTVDFGWFYPLVLVPVAVTCAANGFNMLEGFNGLGAGNAIIIASGLAILAWLEGASIALLILIPLIGALLAFLEFNLVPARAFPGDAGTLLFGTALAAAAILGKLEFAAAVMFLLVVAEFALKARARFPSTGWGGDLRAGKLYCPEGIRPVGLGQLVLRTTGGLTERNLVLVLHGLQAAVAVLSIAVVAGTA